MEINEFLRIEDKKGKMIVAIIAAVFIAGTFAMHIQEYGTYIQRLDTGGTKEADAVRKDNEIVQRFVCEYDGLS